jgi:hypothetical protein
MSARLRRFAKTVTERISFGVVRFPNGQDGIPSGTEGGSISGPIAVGTGPAGEV